jgi:hypothetical protein
LAIFGDFLAIFCYFLAIFGHFSAFLDLFFGSFWLILAHFLAHFGSLPLNIRKNIYYWVLFWFHGIKTKYISIYNKIFLK